MISLREAAERRAESVQEQRHRPSQRRAAEDDKAQARPAVRRSSHMNLRAGSNSGSDVLRFEGMASVTGRSYEMWDMFGPYGEIVVPGAFAESLGRSDLDCPLVINHEPMRRIASTVNGTLALSEILSGEETGLLCEADLDPADPDVAYIAPKLRSGLINEMSFRFAITRGAWSPDWTEYHIESVDLERGDVSIVGYGANPYTSGTLRGLDAIRRLSDAQAREAFQELERRFAPARRPIEIRDDEIVPRSIPGL